MCVCGVGELGGRGQGGIGGHGGGNPGVKRVGSLREMGKERAQSDYQGGDFRNRKSTKWQESLRKGREARVECMGRRRFTLPSPLE